MHPLQSKLLELAQNQNLGEMSLREIGKFFGEEKYPQKIKHHLLQLEKKGLLKINNQKKKTEVVQSKVENYLDLFSIPIFGCAHCGGATIFAQEKITGYLKVSTKLLPENKEDLIAVRAVGTSMNRANINGKSITSGDYLIIDSKAKHPSNGDYVLSRINGYSAIKKIFIYEDQIVLASDSTEEYPPIIVDAETAYQTFIGGTVIKVIKKPN